LLNFNLQSTQYPLVTPFQHMKNKISLGFSNGSHEKRLLPLSYPSIRMYHRGSHRTDFREIWNWRFIWQTCGEKPNLIKFGQKYFTWKPRYVLSFPMKLNRHKTALFERNCIRLLEQPRRYTHNANAPQCYFTRTLSTFLYENGYNKLSTKIIIPTERLPKRPECKPCTPNYNIQHTPFSPCSSLYVCITAHESVTINDVDDNVTT
jgi:hypothetical protein